MQKQQLNIPDVVIGVVTLCFCIFLSACQPAEKSAVIAIKPYYKDIELSCDNSFSHGGKTWQIEQFLLYLSDVEFQTISDEWQSWPMEVSASQTERVALIGQHCKDINANGNWQLKLTQLSLSNKSAITKIRFVLGIPFELNHLNPLTQPSPLNDSSMFWVWQTGHKFMRLETLTSDDNWLFHLGATGCQSASVMRAPQDECKYPNTVDVELAYDANNPTIVFDLAKLLKGVELTQSTSCQSANQDENCEDILNNVGVNAAQTGFRLP